MALTQARRFSFACELEHSRLIIASKCWTSSRQPGRVGARYLTFATFYPPAGPILGITTEDGGQPKIQSPPYISLFGRNPDLNRITRIKPINRIKVKIKSNYRLIAYKQGLKSKSKSKPYRIELCVIQRLVGMI